MNLPAVSTVIPSLRNVNNQSTCHEFHTQLVLAVACGVVYDKFLQGLNALGSVSAQKTMGENVVAATRSSVRPSCSVPRAVLEHLLILLQH
jgi:hypothetical protein